MGMARFESGTPLNLNGITASLIATADFNGDGKPDILLAGSSTFVYVFMGKGDGTFQPAVSTNIGTTLTVISAADVNGDGKADILALGNLGGGTALWEFIGNGDGTFAAGVQITNAANPTAPLRLGDFNGDGKPDIAVGDSGVGIEVLLNNGSGTFQNPIIVSLPYFTGAMFAGDFNGDHKLDLVVSIYVCGSGNNEAVTLLGNGDGTFQSPIVAIPPDRYGSLVAAADLNGDGRSDLVQDVFEEPAVEIYLSNGDGTFTAGSSYLQYGPTSSSFLVADFNGDNKPDLAAMGEVLLGNGDGTFQGNRAVLVLYVGYTLAGFTSEAIGDFNGDGSPDVATVSNTGPFIYLNDGAGNLSLAYSYTPGGYVLGMPTADVNGDAKLDLVLLGYANNSPNLTLMLGNGDGSFGSPTVFFQGPMSPPVVLADFNGDHRPDVAVLLNGEVGIFLNNGNGTFASPASYFVGNSPTSFVTGDFNNDGKMDIVAVSSAGIGFLLGNGDGTFQPVAFSMPGTFYAVSAAADLNHDGNLDLVAVAYAGNGQGYVLSVLLGKGDGTFTVLPPTNLPFESSYGPTVVSVADVNGDGIPDLVWAIQQSSPRQILAALGKGDGTFGSQITIFSTTIFPNEGPTLLTLLADLKHDSKPDVVASIDNVVVTLLNVSQPGFTMATSPLSPATIAAGGSATSQVSVNSLWGFKGSVSLSCSSITLNGTTATTAPPTCSFNPASVANGSGTSMLTVSTTGSSAMLRPEATRHPGLFYAMWLPFAAWC